MIYIFFIVFIFSCADAENISGDTGNCQIDEISHERTIEIDTSGLDRDESGMGCIEEDGFENEVFKKNFKIQEVNQKDNQVTLPINKRINKNLKYSQCPMQK